MGDVSSIQLSSRPGLSDPSTRSLDLKLMRWTSTHALWNSSSASRSSSFSIAFVSTFTSSWLTTSAGSDEGRGGVDPSKSVCANEPPSALRQSIEQERE